MKSRSRTLSMSFSRALSKAGSRSARSYTIEPVRLVLQLHYNVYGPEAVIRSSRGGAELKVGLLF